MANLRESDLEGEPTFEEAVARLETIVAGLETGNWTLNESMAGYEEAMVLTRRCTALLEAAEQRIRTLSEDGRLRPSELEQYVAAPAEDVAMLDPFDE